MAEYIDREALLQEISKQKAASKHSFPRRSFVVGDVIACIRTAPAADVAPVVHGKNVTSMHPVDEFICSECGVDITDFCRYDPEEDACYEYEFKCCPNCGAKVDGDADE